MTVPHHDGGEWSSLTGPAASALADEQRRLVLAVLLEETGPVGTERLTREIRTHHPTAGEGHPDRDEVDASLHHTHLPALEAADLVVRPAPDRVALADHPLLDEEVLRPATLRDDDRPWAVLADLVTRPRRLHVVACLANRPTWRVDGLAATVRRRMDPTQLDDVPGGDVAALLYHVDLPRLAEAGVLSYDERTKQVERRELPDLGLLPAQGVDRTAATDGGTGD